MLPEMQRASVALQFMVVAHKAESVMMGCLSVPQVGSVRVVSVPMATQPAPVRAPWAWPLLKVTTLPALPPAAVLPPVPGLPPLPSVPAVPPVCAIPPLPDGSTTMCPRS
jgi:hypothetical protein